MTRPNDQLKADLAKAKNLAWTSWMTELPAIQRIAQTGPRLGSARDTLIVRGIFCLALTVMSEMVQDLNEKMDKLISEVHDK